MLKTDPRYEAYVSILKAHLIPAMGCTEPIAIAYAAAVARRALGELPEKVQVLVSGNIIKNAKSVTVPNTAGRKEQAIFRRSSSKSSPSDEVRSPH